MEEAGLAAGFFVQVAGADTRMWTEDLQFARLSDSGDTSVTEDVAT
jgi:hypothetical protein